MARRRKKREGAKGRRIETEEHGEVPMTPMIDVVFLLLIYFLLTMQPQNVVAHLDVYAPSSERTPPTQKDPPSLIRIGIYSDGYTFDDASVDKANLETFLSVLARASKTQSVLIICDVNARHGRLVGVLDLCAKHGLTNLSVVSGE